MTRSSKTILNKSGEGGIPYFVPDHRGNAFSLSLLSMMLAICLGMFPLCPLLERDFFLIINRCWILSKLFLHLLRCHDFFLNI